MSNFYKDVSSNAFGDAYYGNSQAPVDSTMKRLCQKINDMSKSQQNNFKLSEITTLQHRVQDIESKIQQSLKVVDKTIKQYKQNLMQMSQKLNQIESRNQLCKKVRTNEIKQLQTKIATWINIQKKARISLEQKILQCFQQKFQMVTMDLSTEVQNRKQYLNSLDQKLAQSLPMLKNQIMEELQASCCMMEKFQKTIDQTTESFKDQLAANEESHNQKISKVMHILAETVNQVKILINDERCQRQVKKNQIMELFECAYKKLIL